MWKLGAVLDEVEQDLHTSDDESRAGARRRRSATPSAGVKLLIVTRADRARRVCNIAALISEVAAGNLSHQRQRRRPIVDWVGSSVQTAR